MGRDPQIEEWTAAIAPNVGALQRLLSGLENQWTLWPQIRAFQESPGRLKEGDTGKPLPPTTTVKVDGHLGPAAYQPRTWRRQCSSDLWPAGSAIPARGGRAGQPRREEGSRRGA